MHNDIIAPFFRVTYASAGCLPDSDPDYFDTIEAAAESIVDEHDGICWVGPDGYLDPAAAGVVLTTGDVIERASVGE